MFKKASDNVHYLERTGSHATRGGARGTPWFNQLSDEEKEIIEIKRACDTIRVQFGRIKGVKKRALEAGNKDTAKRCNILLRKLAKHANHLTKKKGIDAIKFRW
jgi:hypothetical protein